MAGCLGSSHSGACKNQAPVQPGWSDMGAASPNQASRQGGSNSRVGQAAAGVAETGGQAKGGSLPASTNFFSLEMESEMERQRKDG
eukprot:1142366-Pelagomonas_calceolata.AAC.6